jgi:hypothetical protein
MLRFVFVKQPAMMFHNDCAWRERAGALATLLVLDNHERKRKNT